MQNQEQIVAEVQETVQTNVPEPELPVPPQPIEKPSFDHGAFQNSLDLLSSHLTQKYQPILSIYRTHLIPFEKSIQKRSLRVQSSFNEKDKIDLLMKLDKLQSEKSANQTNLSAMLEKYEAERFANEKLVQQNEGFRKEVEQLHNHITDLEKAVLEKQKMITTVQEDKTSFLTQLEKKNAEYNTLAGYMMNEKMKLAHKLNELNQIEESLAEKLKNFQEQKFYFENEKRKFEESKKGLLDRKPTIKDEVMIPSGQRDIEEESEENRKNKGREEIAKHPIKKVVKHHNAEIYCITASYNGNLLATCGGDKIIRLYDPVNLKTTNSITSNSADSIYLSLHLNYVGDKMVVGSTNKSVSIYSTNSGKLLESFMGHGQKVNSVAFTNSKERCASGSDDRQLKIWDMEKGSNFLSVNTGKTVKIITPNHAEPIVYTGHGDGSVRVYSINQGTTPLNQIKGIIDYAISSVTLSSNRNQILVGSREGSKLYVFDIRANKILKTYQDKEFFNQNQHFRADYSPTEKFIVAGNCDGSIYYWNTETQRREAKIAGHEGIVTSVLYHPFTGVLASADARGNMILWNSMS